MISICTKLILAHVSVIKLNCI